MAQVRCPHCGDFEVGTRETGGRYVARVLGIPLGLLGALLTIIGIVTISQGSSALALAIPGILLMLVGVLARQWQRLWSSAHYHCGFCGYEWDVDSRD
jgi:hypothetical protein